jgi:hypothetical protein
MALATTFYEKLTRSIAAKGIGIEAAVDLVANAAKQHGLSPKQCAAISQEIAEMAPHMRWLPPKTPR